jgi:hypothetical protein
MEETADLFFEQLKKFHDAKDVRDWYAKYFAENAFPRCEFRSVLGLLGSDPEEKDLLVFVTDIFHMSQEKTDDLSLQEVKASYERSMDIISAFTLYSSIYPMMHEHVRDRDLRKELAELYNDVSFHLNAPRAEEGPEVLEARRRFYFDLYLPLQVHFIFSKDEFRISNGLEEDFIRLYLIKSGGLDGERLGSPMPTGLPCSSGVFCAILNRMADLHEAVSKVLDFLFNEKY